MRRPRRGRFTRIVGHPDLAAGEHLEVAGIRFVSVAQALFILTTCENGICPKTGLPVAYYLDGQVPEDLDALLEDTRWEARHQRVQGRKGIGPWSWG